MNLINFIIGILLGITGQVSAPVEPLPTVPATAQHAQDGSPSDPEPPADLEDGAAPDSEAGRAGAAGLDDVGSAEEQCLVGGLCDDAEQDSDVIDCDPPLGETVSDGYNSGPCEATP